MAGVRFNTDIVKRRLSESGNSSIKLSTMLLNKSSNYISGSLDRGRMGEEELKKLCKFIDVKYEDVVIIPSEEPVKEPEAKSSSGNAGYDYNDKIDLLTVGVNTLYETQSDTNALLKDLIQELRATNTKLERMEKRINSIETAAGQVVSKVIVANESHTEVSGHLREIKSTLAIVKGRTKDICDALTKDTKHKYISAV